MFTNAKVGDKVVSEYYGIGTIVELDIGSQYPIEAKFADLETTAYYTLQGEYWCENSFNYKEDRDYNITPLYQTKLGSPDARRIVAMLAREYRYCKNTDKANNLLYIAARTTKAFHRYQQAKQLLGK